MWTHITRTTLLLMVIIFGGFSETAPTRASRCANANAPSFAKGDVVQVNSGEAQNVREAPTTGANVLKSVPEGEYLTVFGGPECADGYTWWQVEYDRKVGWTAEASQDGSAAWLSKVDMTLFEKGSIRLEMSPLVGSSLGFRDYDTNYGDGFDDPAHRLFTLEENPPVHHATPYQGYWQGIPSQGGIIIAPRTDIVNQRPDTPILQSLLDNQPFRNDELMIFIQTADVQDSPQLAYLPLLGGVAERWIGYPDPRGFKGDRYVAVPQNFKYYLQGLSGDAQYYIAALFSVTVNIEMPLLPDLPADRSGADAGYRDYIQSVNASLDALPPEAFTPRLALLDAMMRSIEITGEIELQPDGG